MMSRKSNRKFFITAIFFSCFILFIIPQLKYNVSSFPDRAMGNAIMFEVNISKRVNAVYLLCCILIPIVTILINKLLNRLLSNTKPTFYKYVNIISTLGIINILMEFINMITTSKDVVHGSYILLGINLIIIINASIKKSKSFKLQDVKWSFMATIPIAFIGTFIMHKLNIGFEIELYNFILLFFIGIAIILLALKFIKMNKPVLKKAYIFFLLSPLLEYVYLELYNILNQYNIILKHKAITICSIYAICFALTTIYYIINKKKTIKFSYTKYYYPIIILIFTFIISSIPMINTVNTDFFESANHGLGVYELFRYGKIPIVETFDAHMMSSQMWGIVYGLLNNDINGAIFCLYSSYKNVLFYLILYFFLKKIFSKDISFLMIMFVPFICDMGVNSYGIGLLAIITLINAYKKQDKKSFTLFWLSLVFLCLYKLDIGFSASIAAVTIMIFLYIKNRKTMKLKDILIPLGVIILLFLSLFVGICIIKDINPIMRLIEFLKISMSNLNWGWHSLGDKQTLAYSFVYYIMPLIVISTLIYTMCSKKAKINNKSLIMIFLALFYISNIQRGMVRHTLFWGNITNILSFSLLYLAIFVMYNSKNAKKFLLTYSILIACRTLLLNPNANTYLNLYSSALNEHIQFKLQSENYSEKVDRIKLSTVMTNEYKDLKVVLENILDEDETYLDLSNQNLLYALIGKEKPVYVNQSPGLLSGELTQQMYIKEVIDSKKDVPVILKARKKDYSTKLDGLENDYRYYLLSEFTFSKYELVAEVNEYEIWIDKKVLEEKKNKLQNLTINNLKMVDINEYLSNNVKDINLGGIAFLWGEYDENKDKIDGIQIKDNIVLEKGKEEIVPIDIANINKQNGNYIKFEISSEINTKLTVSLKSETSSMGKYEFNVKAGKHTYIIRASTMYSWYEGNINNLILNSNEKIEITNIEIAEADTIKQF